MIRFNESSRRNSSVEENIELFEGMLTGKNSFYLRANHHVRTGGMILRDPVLYHPKNEPHFRSGKYAYPTQTLIDIILDSRQGVTHVLADLSKPNRVLLK